MDAALYDPDHGYYSTRASIGFEGDYLTAPDLGPHLGRALSRAMADFWQQLGKPHSWDLVEAGAGRGTLLRDVLASLERERPDAARGVRPAIVEVSQHLRAQQSSALDGRDIRWASDPRALGPIEGVLYANERVNEILGVPKIDDTISPFTNIVAADREIFERSLAQVMLDGVDVDLEVAVATRRMGDDRRNFATACPKRCRWVDGGK